MFPVNVKVSSRIAAEGARIGTMQLTDYYHRAEDDFQAILPPKPPVSGQARLFTAPQFGMLCLVSDLVASGVKAPLAAKIARRVMDAHRVNPSVEQFAIVATDNGNVSCLAYDQTELRTGFISGARLNFALVVDLKTYADRVTAAIAGAPKVIGGDDAE